MAWLLAAIRTTIFIFFLYAPFTIFWATLSVLVAWMIPKRFRYYFVIYVWTSVMVFFMRWVVGIRYRIVGRENIPAKGVIACNHQSTWETYFLQTLFYPQTQVIKKSLLKIPFFGWAFALLNPIAINRSDRRSAMQQVIEQGTRHFQEDNTYVLIFPEGTRYDVQKLGKFTRGGAVLAKAAGVPFIPVAQNAGYCWINKRYVKFPGLVTVEILPPIDMSNMTSEQATNLAHAQIQSALERAPVPR
ncbi:lysophospholipid acyltransferase family protein [Gynuella sp.]|uniref:lysophospholipid acyltransferase family protein n=1 Tax=Gynuella sp. TaxID=2969146 RepID=UPI003D0C017E